MAKKKVNIKDVDVQETEKVKNKINFKKILLIILMIIVSLVGIFFWSTKIRWEADIAEHYEILYYGQEEIEINHIVDFYGEELSNTLDTDEAYLMYCTEEYGDECITADFTNKFDNLLRDPTNIINIVILIDLILLFLILKDKNFGKIKSYIIVVVIMIYGLFRLGVVIFNVADYYFFVNDSRNVTEGIITKGLYTENEKEFYPVVYYRTVDDAFTTYIDNPIKGRIEDKKEQAITLYYDTKDNSIVTPKRSLLIYILPLIIAGLYITFSLLYLSHCKKIWNIDK